jgi:O-antigen/teichoic acid export membrane protein
MKLWQTYRSKFIILLDQGIVSGASFLLSILLVRLLGIQIFGEFSIILLVTQGTVAINQSLVTSPYQSLYAQRDINQYSRKLKGIQILVIGLFGLLLFMFQFTIEIFQIQILTLPILLFSIYLIGTVLFDFNRKQLFLHEKYIYCLVKDFLSVFSQLSLIVFLVSIDKFNSLEDILLATGSCLLLVEGSVFLFTTRPKLPSILLLKTHWSFGKWMLGNSILQWFSGNFYITTGVLLMGAQVAGIIRIGQSIIGIWGVFIQVLENYVPPLVAQIYKKNGMNALKLYLMNLTIKGGAMIGFVAILLIIFRNIIWDVIYDVEFIEYSYIMFWFGPILVFNFLGFPFRFAIRTLNKTHILFEAYILSCLLGFSTAHFFINTMGIHGICLGLLLTQVVMQVWYSYRLFKIKHNEDHSYSIR